MAKHKRHAEPSAAEGSSTADEPGRPMGADELDPELLTLPRTSARIGPVLAISIVVFCVYIIIVLRGDLRFSRQGAEPAPFETPAALLERGQADSFVRVPAVPDRSFAIRVAHSAADTGSRVAPVQGTNGALWLLLGGNAWVAGIQYEEVYRGRLRALNALPFAEDVREYVARRGRTPRFVTPQAVKDGLSQGAAVLVEPAGDTIAVAADTPVRIYETVADQARIMVVPTDRHPSAAEWTTELATLGLVPQGAAPEPGNGDSWVYVASVPGGLAAVQTILGNAKLFSARAEAIRAEHETTWGALSASPDALAYGVGAAIPWSSISWIAVMVPRQVPAGAMVLLTEERPDTYWYVLPLVIGMAAFALLFAWALVRSLRRT